MLKLVFFLSFFVLVTSLASGEHVFSKNGVVSLTKDDHVWSTSDWSDEFKVEFDVIVNKELPGRWINLFHLTTGEDLGVGGRIPAVFLNSAKYFYTCYHVNGNNDYCQNYNYELNKAYHFEIFQQKNSEGEAVYSITVNGERVHEIVNTTPLKYKDVKLYLSDPWYETFAPFGKLSNLKIIANDVSMEPDIIKLHTDSYKLIWKDSGSGAHLDGSIWAVENYLPEYCSVGDVMGDGHGKPTSKAFLVKANKVGALRSPTGFTPIWKNDKSMAHGDVGIYNIDCPLGYSNLGQVAVPSHSTVPDKSKYCCVRNEYLTSGEYRLSWNDKGEKKKKTLFGAVIITVKIPLTVSFWKVVRGSDPFGVEGGYFWANKNNEKPRPSPVTLLKVDGVKVKDFFSLDDDQVEKPLNLYEITDLTKVWDDSGSGARDDVSIWKAEAPSGYLPVGHIAIRSHQKPSKAYVIKAVEGRADTDALVLPVSYDKIWDDSGSGAKSDVTIWRALCPGGYVALSNVATNGNKPSRDSIYCIKIKYTSSRNWNWQKVWADHDSGAKDDVTIYEAIASNTIVTSVRGMGTIASHQGKPQNPYLLRSSEVEYLHEKPVANITITNVNYDLAREIADKEPAAIFPTSVVNEGHIEQCGGRAINFVNTEESSFTSEVGFEIGVSVTLESGIPYLWESQTTISSKVSLKASWGSKTSKQIREEVKANICIPPRSRMEVRILRTKYKADIPFTADTIKTYYDGTTQKGKMSGVWKGSQVKNAQIVYGEIHPLD